MFTSVWVELLERNTQQVLPKRWCLYHITRRHIPQDRVIIFTSFLILITIWYFRPGVHKIPRSC